MPISPELQFFQATAELIQAICAWVQPLLVGFLAIVLMLWIWKASFHLPRG
jgi:hypothetical protein